MSKLNMNKSEWLELVFEGKNKEYGAYKLRQENEKTTIKAFFSALAIISGLALLPVILSSFGEKPIVVDPDIIVTPLTLSNVETKKVEVKKAEQPAQKQVQKTVVKKPILKVAEKDNATKTDLTKTTPLNTNPSPNTGANTAAVGGGGNTGGGGGSIVPEAVPEFPINEPLSPAILDRQPSFPGGLSEFTKIVGKKFVTPEIEEEKIIKILVYFVVERDGSISNITVPRNPGFNLDVEAIRVLKSIKTKWDPGYFNGKPVRTNYSLPILIKMQ